MAKRYMGEGDPVLDALYEELNATGRKNRTDRRKRRQLEREIRKVRAGRLGGIRGLFRGLVDDVGQGLLRQHISQPQIDQFADETQANIAAEAAGEERPFETPAQDVLGFRTRRSFQPRAEVPETVAVPEIEEVEITAEEAEPRRGDLTRRSQFPFGVYTGEYAEQFGNDPVQEMLSKLGPNQLRTLERRKRKMAQWPDAFPADYATPEGLRKYAHGGTLTGQADRLARAGRGNDTMLMHVTPEEVQGLASLVPGMMTINPETGLPEAGMFGNILGFALPFVLAMIPGMQPLAAAAIGGAGGSLLRGGDLKDAMLGGITGLAGGALMQNLGGAGADVLAGEAATEALTGEAALSLADPTAMSMAGDAFTKAGIDPVTFQEAVSGGIEPLSYLSTVAEPAQIAAFKSGLTDVARSNIPTDSFTQNIKNIGAGGLGGLKDQLMTLPGLGAIAGTGLQAQMESQRMFEEGLIDMEEARKRREDAYYQMYPENIPYAGGGSIYKNRYINGNWS